MNIPGPGRASGHFPAGAFTLVELLVVIGILALLASILLPALAGAKRKGHKIACLNNHRQLMLAVHLYADDFGGRYPYNFGTDETLRTIQEGRYLNWVNNVMSWELEPGNTNVFLLAAGGIGPYVSGAPSLFRCPTDKALSDIQRKAGWRGRTRSLSMNAMIGDAGHFTESGNNVNNPHYQQFFTVTQIPNPAMIFILMEEHPDSINDAYFLNKVYSHEWNDLPASYHDGAANLAFADGHVESHTWVNPGTKPPPRPDAANLPLAVPEDAEDDFYWMMKRTSLRRASDSGSR